MKVKKIFSSVIGLALIASVSVAGNASAVRFDESLGENVFTITYDFNDGATFGGEGTYEEESVAVAPDLNTYTLVDCFDFIELEDGEIECHPLDVERGKELEYVTVNGERHDLGEGDGYMLDQDTTIVYYWIDREPNKEATDGNGNSAYFYDGEEEREFNLYIQSLSLNMTDEDLEEIGMPREEYDLGKSAIVAVVGDEGDVLTYMEILVCDANPEEDFCPHDIPITVRLRIPEDAKGYDIYKLMFVDITITDDGEVLSDSEDPIICELDGEDFIVCDLPHLSGYALIGSNEEEEEDAPNTSDNIAVYIAIFGISLAAFVATLVITRKTTTKD